MYINDVDTLLKIISMPSEPLLKRVPVKGLENVHMTMSPHDFNQKCIMLTYSGKQDEASRLVISRYMVKENGERFFTDDSDPRIKNLQCVWGSRIMDAYTEANHPDEEFIKRLMGESEADRT